LNTGPGDGKAIAVEVERAHQRDVFAVAVVVVAGDVAGGAVVDFAGGVRETVPDGFALAALVPRAFNLVSGGGGAQ